MPLFGLVPTLGDVLPWVAILVDSAIKGAVILAAAGAVAAAARRASASVRHLAWTLAVVGLCVLPVLSILMPRWRVPLLPSQIAGTITATPEPSVAKSDPFKAEVDPERILRGGSEPPVVAEDLKAFNTTVTATAHQRTSGLLFFWAGGALLVLARLAFSLIAAWDRGRRAAPITDGAWTSLVAELAHRHGIRRHVALRVAAEGVMPATWGHARPVVLLSVEALDWPQDRLRAVLSHELAHVARGDFLVQTGARIACALHWFNPLVWLAERRLRVECEQASDDLVLGAGLTPSDYATHLLEVLMTVRRGVDTPRSALAMGRREGLESRLRAILDSERPRYGLSSRRIALMTLAAACFLLPLAFVRLEARAHDVPKLERLPQGVTIEVIGVSTHPSGPGTWWKPDGTPLAKAPCDPVPKEVNFRGPLVREVVARITGLPENAGLAWYPRQCTSHGIGTPQKDGVAVPELRQAVADFTDGLATCTVRFDLALGPWVTEHAAETSAGIEKGDRAFFFGKPHAIRQGTALTIAHNIADRDVRVVAIGRDGGEHHPSSTSSGGGKNLRALDVEFDVPPDQIREYQLQSRPVGRFEIQNVALHPKKNNS